MCDATIDFVAAGQRRSEPAPEIARPSGFQYRRKTLDFFYYSVYKGFDTQNGCRPILARACRSFLWRSRHGFIVITFFSQRIYLNDDDLSVRGKRPEKPRTKNFEHLFFYFLGKNEINCRSTFLPS